MKKNTRAGLTLVELLVVLAILAVVTIIAVQATESLVDQARYNATQQTLQNVQNAIMGPNNQFGANGSPNVGGFVADMGRLPTPVYTGGTLVGDPLRELWDPSAVAANLGAAYSATGDPLSPGGITIPSRISSQTGAATLKTSATVNYTATIPSGWRGPYLQLPPGSTALLDGWGNPFQSIYQPPGATTYPPLPLTAPSLSFPVNVVISFGSDNTSDLIAPPATPYAQDQYVPAQTTAPPTVFPLANFSQQAYGTITVTVQSVNTTVTPTALTNPYATTEVTPKVRIVLFAPVNGVMTSFILDSTPGPLASYNPNASPATYLGVTPYYPSYVPNPTPVDFAIAATTTSYAGTFFTVPIGPRAIQAFQYDASTMIITKRSPLTYLTVTPNSTLTPTLIVQ